MFDHHEKPDDSASPEQIDPLARVLARHQPRSQMTVGDMVAAQAAQQPNATCFVTDDGRQFSYSQVNRDVNRLARAFRARGWRQGDRVAVLATDSVEYVEVVMACLKLGLVYCCLNVRLRDSELHDMLRRIQPKALVAGPQYVDQSDTLVSALSPRPEVLVMDMPSASPRSLRGALEDIADASDVAVVPYGEDIVSIAFTSGTTGQPKAVLQSARMVREVIMGGLRETQVTQDDFRYNGPPLFHVSGLGSAMFGVAAGGRTLLLPQFDAERVLHWLQAGGLTSLFLVPTMLSSLLRQPTIASMEYPELRSLVYGASPMTPALLKRVMGIFDCDLYNIFGPGTEGAWQATLTPADHRAALAGRTELLNSVGRPVPSVALKIVDDDFQEVPHGVVGNIVSRSESVMSGYLDQPDLEATALHDGWLRSGDLGCMDDEGYLFLASRTADMIIRGGENVYPIEIESRIAEHSDVAQVAVVGRPDEHWGEVIAAAVVPTAGTTLDEQDLQSFCRETLASFKVPTVIEFVTELPLNSTGKVQKNLVADIIDERQGRLNDTLDAGTPI